VIGAATNRNPEQGTLSGLYIVASACTLSGRRRGVGGWGIPLGSGLCIFMYIMPCDCDVTAVTHRRITAWLTAETQRGFRGRTREHAANKAAD
jgi:hypothetical protein